MIALKPTFSDSPQSFNKLRKWGARPRSRSQPVCWQPFVSPIGRAISMRREALHLELAGHLDGLTCALDERTETMASFDSARDPDDLIS
jgi:hypothetical protein